LDAAFKVESDTTNQSAGRPYSGARQDGRRRILENLAIGARPIRFVIDSMRFGETTERGRHALALTADGAGRRIVH